MKNSKLLTATAIFAVAITAAATTMSLTSAYRNNQATEDNLPNRPYYNRMMNGSGTDITQRPFYSEERHTAMEEAFKNNDYEAWKTLMTENRRTAKVIEVITEENFDKMVEIHELMEAGKYEEAQKIREELGIGMGRTGFRNRFMEGGFGQKAFGRGCPRFENNTNQK